MTKPEPEEVLSRDPDEQEPATSNSEQVHQQAVFTGHNVKFNVQ